MIFLDIDKGSLDDTLNEKLKDENFQEITAEQKVELLARATLDKRLNTKDLKLYSYVMNFAYLYYTQEEISDMLDMSRANVNRSFAKLSAFNYIRKFVKGSLKQGARMTYVIRDLNVAGISELEPQSFMKLMNVDKMAKEDKFKCFNKEDIVKMKEGRKLAVKDISTLKELIDYKEVDIEYYLKNIEKLVSFDADTCIKMCEKGWENLNKNKKIKVDKDFFDYEISFLNNYIENIDNDLEDTYKIEEDFENFRKNFHKKTNILTEQQVNELLKDDNIFLLLFVQHSDDHRIIRFKELYFDEYIKFLVRFTDLGEKEDFFKVLYEHIKIEKIAYEEVLKILEFTHRDTPVTKRAGRTFILECIENAIDKIDNIDSICKDNDKIGKVNELEELRDDILSIQDKINDKQIDFDILCKIIALTSNQDRFKECYNLDFNEYLKLFNLEIHEFCNKIYMINHMYEELSRIFKM